MMYIGFSPMYSFEETLRLYEELKNSMIPWTFLKLLNQKGILTKNGTRKKIYLEKGERKCLKIQRMVFNHKIYFDLFPLSLIPNSIFKVEDLEDNPFDGLKRPPRNSFFKWLKSQDLDKDIFQKFITIGSKGNITFYKSIMKYAPYTTKKGKRREKTKKNIYLIYYHFI
ncbi:MAG: hypothetical protein II508_07765 [Acholeplasmatales bacterium]|nr:hypothetical protein [Acholeplasmatales bacterium]